MRQVAGECQIKSLVRDSAVDCSRWMMRGSGVQNMLAFPTKRRVTTSIGTDSHRPRCRATSHRLRLGDGGPNLADMRLPVLWWWPPVGVGSVRRGRRGPRGCWRGPAVGRAGRDRGRNRRREAGAPKTCRDRAGAFHARDAPSCGWRAAQPSSGSPDREPLEGLRHIPSATPHRPVCFGGQNKRGMPDDQS